MLSILIPTYNYDVRALAKELHSQCSGANIVFEILIYDDASQIQFVYLNETINAIERCRYVPLQKNIGRSAIRNKLANDAKYENLIFLDADVKIENDRFLSNYLNTINNYTEIIYGGISYQKNIPTKDKLLRWVYGKKREALPVSERKKNPYLRFLTLNFFIKKSVFTKLKFNEDIPNLRNEDLIFAMEAKKLNLNILHIENSVVHLGIESSLIFLKKTLDTLHSLKYIINNNLLNNDDAAITKTESIIKKLRLSFLFKIIYKLLGNLFKKNLLSNKPSLFIFDIYRLCYYISIKY